MNTQRGYGHGFFAFFRLAIFFSSASISFANFVMPSSTFSFYTSDVLRCVYAREI